MKDGELGELAIHLAALVQGRQAELKRQVIVAQRGCNAEVGGGVDLGGKEVEAAGKALGEMGFVKEGELFVFHKGPEGALGSVEKKDGMRAFREEDLAGIGDLGELQLQGEGKGGHDVGRRGFGG